MRHQPVVTDFRVRQPTHPHGHWMNRFWWPLARVMRVVLTRLPLHRHVLRSVPAADALLESGDPVIFACTHQDMFDCFNGLPRLLQERSFAAMVSYSRDGSLATMGLRILGYKVVRGSSSHGGGEGLVMLRSCLTSGTSVVMVADGPQAPLGDVKPGIVHLAASARVPILPVRAWGLNRWRLERSWTKTAASLPFLPVAVCIGAPIDVPEEAPDLRPYQLRVAATIADLATWASVWANGPARPPFTVSEE